MNRTIEREPDMRFSFFAPLLSVLFLFPPHQNANAADWIDQIIGNSQSVVVSRKGNFIKAEEMLRLQPGDIVKVQDDKVTVRILLGSGAVKNITKAQSPYTVSGKQGGSSFLNNLVGEVKKMLVASSDQTEPVEFISRGMGKKLSILAVGDEENLVLAGSKNLSINWQGGKAPYSLELIDVDNDKSVLTKSGISDHQLVVDGAKVGESGLAAGEYEVALESLGVTPPTSQEIGLSIVDKDQLPENAQKLLELKLDERVEARLMVNLLHKLPKWRFYAYNLAVSHGLEKEQKLLLNMK